ncbi:hypothetical protein [Planktothrix agardhii]|jgi:hypothetical protein|uniref:hypothetical protein n=1 Tax=Planktothrix agardhii TaxID=1160 RepID=UPI0028ABB75B|nr:hypothetical protein [Planktothrix agardhii]
MNNIIVLNFKDGNFNTSFTVTLLFGDKTEATNLQDRLNLWLNSESFDPIHQKLTEILHANPEVQLFIETDNQQLQQLPWHSWNILNSYPKIIVFNLSLSLLIIVLILGLPIYLIILLFSLITKG